MSAAATLAEWEQRLNSLDPTHIELGLTRVAAVKQRLFTDIELPPIVTVAGTNGKGSTVALMAACLQQANYQVACYTSPHLIDLNERIAVNGAPIADQEFVTALNAVESAQQGTALTYFEYLTLSAVWHFAQQGVDVILLEVGLGGRLDAVNVFDPQLSVVTHIGIDHVDWLGDDREKIGFEKAGIFRRGCPAIYADPEPVSSVIDHAKSCGAIFQQYNGQEDLPETPNLAGLPASTRWGAWAALDALPEALATSEAQRHAGFANAAVAGRFQTLLSKPLLVVDVAHNPDSAVLLAKKLQAQSTVEQWIAVFAAYADKAIDEIAEPLLPIINQWLCCQLDSSRALQASNLAAQLAELGAVAAVSPSAESAVDKALSLASGPQQGIIVFGSFETAGAAIRHLKSIQTTH